MKICRKFHIKTPFCFLLYMRVWYMWKVYLQPLSELIECLKLAYSLKNFKIWRENNSGIKIKNATFSGYCFNIKNTNVYGDFQICISVPFSAASRRFFGHTVFLKLRLDNLVILKTPNGCSWMSKTMIFNAFGEVYLCFLKMFLFLSIRKLYLI